MVDRDKPEFLAFLARLGELYDKKLTTIVMEEYWDSLYHYEMIDLMAVKGAIKDKCRRFPTVAEIVEAIRTMKGLKPLDNRPKLLHEPWTALDSHRSALWALLSRWLWHVPENRKKYSGEFKSMTYEEQGEWLLNWINEMSKDDNLVQSMKNEVSRMAAQ